MGRVLLILGLMALLPVAARADVTVQLGHIKLHLPVPDGYCALDANRVRDSALYDFEAKTLDGRGRLLAVAADCGELEGWRQSNHPVQRIINYAAATKDGVLVRQAETDRAKFIDDFAHDAGTIGTHDAAAFTTRWWNSFDGNAEIELFDATEHDGNAAYLRMVRLNGARQKISVASVWAVTAVGGYDVSMNLYQHGDSGTLGELVAVAKRAAAQLIADNPPVVVVPPPPLVTADQAVAEGAGLPSIGSLISGQSTSTIAMIAGGVMLVALMMLRALRPTKLPPGARQATEQ